MVLHILTGSIGAHQIIDVSNFNNKICTIELEFTFSVPFSDL
jgi:hypothetical protein